MKSWFPFTDYDFYAYLTAGMLLIAAIDYSITGGALVYRNQWPVVDVVFWAALAYLCGHIVAAPASAVIEHLIARRLLRPPVTVILTLAPPRRLERVVSALFGLREYRPFPQSLRERILAKVAASLNVQATAVTDPEEVFHIAFPYARSVADCAARLDSFINQYGLCRNVAFAAVIAAVLLSIRYCRDGSAITGWLAVGAAFLAAGLFIRFLKFYSAYACEVLRTFNKVAP